jgi:pyruvate dehydrogenase E2 component (dihydrolipoamide acetyltransferase)
MSVMEVKVPDIGDFKDVPIIEIAVKPGDVVKTDDPLVTLESDKATMEVPAPSEGKVVQVLVKIGDKVSEGSLIVRLEAGEQPVSAPSVLAQQEPELNPRRPPRQAPRRLSERAADKRLPPPIALDFGGACQSQRAPPCARACIDLISIKGSGDKGRVTKTT